MRSANVSNTIRPLLIGLALTATALSRSAAVSTVDVAIPGRTNAYPSLAASGEFAVLTWGATTKQGVTDVFVALSRDGGSNFAAPSRVNRLAGEADFSGEQPPRIALIPRTGREPAIVVVWSAKTAAGTQLLSARSDDAGKTFALPFPLPGSEASGNRGWQSIATDRKGGVATVWLDHREIASSRAATTSTGHAGHQHRAGGQKPADGVARAQLSKLMFSRLGEPGSSRTLTGGVCYCCKTAIATDASGGVYAAWRHVYEGNIRDIAFTKSSDGGRTFSRPVRVSDDNWVLDGCPENGPAIAVDDANRIHVVWPTLIPGSKPSAEPTLALFYAMSTDGRRFTPRQPVPIEGFPRHPQIAVRPNGELIVAWDEQARGTRRIALARGRVDAKGSARVVRQSIADGQRAEYPAVAQAGDATIVAWTSGPIGQTVIRTQRLVNY
jgi:hypothetical protein